MRFLKCWAVSQTWCPCEYIGLCGALVLASLTCGSAVVPFITHFTVNLTLLCRTYSWLNHNKLTGSIPDSLSNLSHTRDLYLNDNDLTGSIPESLGDLVQMQQLHLNDNNLTGPIPTSFGRLVNITGL